MTRIRTPVSRRNWGSGRQSDELSSGNALVDAVLIRINMFALRTDVPVVLSIHHRVRALGAFHHDFTPARFVLLSLFAKAHYVGVAQEEFLVAYKGQAFFHSPAAYF